MAERELQERMGNMKLKKWLKKRNPYCKKFFVSNRRDVAELLRSKGLTDDEITSVSGVIARMGYKACMYNVKQWQEQAEQEAGNE